MRRDGSSRIRQEVCQAAIWLVMSEGKSEPLSTIQETVLDCGGGENRRAPMAA